MMKTLQSPLLNFNEFNGTLNAVRKLIAVIRTNSNLLGGQMMGGMKDTEKKTNENNSNNPQKEMRSERFRTVYCQ